MSRYQLNPQKYLTPNEEADLRRLLPKLSERDSLYFEVLLETGARLNEGLNILSTDLISERCSVFLRGLKGSNDREVAIPPALFNRLNRYCIGRDRPFPFSDANADRIWRLIRPVKKKLHSLRHTFAINTLKRTRRVELVQYALGHRNIANTMIYLDYERAEEFRAAMFNFKQAL